MSIQEQVIAIIAEQALMAPEDIRLTDSPTDLGIDSMGLVESIFAIEETFDVTVPNSESVSTLMPNSCSPIEFRL